MNLPEYEYKGLMAESWDVLRGDTSDWSDRFFYLEAVKRFGQPVLDVGCGTGRILLDFLEQGIDIDGVDNSPDMLAICQQKANRLNLKPKLYHQHVEALDLPRQYQTILVPSSSLQLIIEPELVERALKRIYDHLLPDGILVASIMKLWQEGDPLESEWEDVAVCVEDGVAFRRVSRTRYDPEIECEHTEDYYQKIIDGQVVAEERHQRSPATRAYRPSQITSLFQKAGFVNLQLLGDFTFDPIKLSDNVFVITGQKPGKP